MSKMNNLKYNCVNCSNQDQIRRLTVAYRCSKCQFINCLMCKKTHDNACELFNKNIENISKVMSGSIKSTIVPSTTNKLKRASNIQKLDVSKNTLSVSKTDNLESVSKKPKIIKRRYTIAHDKADKTMTESELKCNTCDLFFKTKGTLSRHMKSNKHAAKVKSLKEDQSEEPEASTSSTATKVERFSSAETIINDYGI